MLKYNPKHFTAAEFVPQSVFSRFGDLSLRFLSPDLLELCDNLRAIFGPCSINDWNIGGSRQSCGLRLPDDPNVKNTPLSAHLHGCAADLHFTAYTPDQVREWIRKNAADPRIAMLTEVEADTMGWVHAVAGTNVKPILFVPNPTKSGGN